MAELTDKELIDLMPRYLKLVEKDSIPLPSVICTLGVDFGENEPQIKLTSLVNRNLSITFYVPEYVKNRFLEMVKKLK